MCVYVEVDIIFMHNNNKAKKIIYVHIKTYILCVVSVASNNKTFTSLINILKNSDGLRTTLKITSDDDVLNFSRQANII